MEFNELNLAELDKDLTPEERDEWQAIYASYRSHSVMRGEAAGVDYHEFEFIPEGKKKSVKEKLRCVIVIPNRKCFLFLYLTADMFCTQCAELSLIL